jgi:hypothetical protein
LISFVGSAKKGRGMTEQNDAIDWSKTTFEGSRREQLRRWRSLSLRERFEALDRLSEQAERLNAVNRGSERSAGQEPGASCVAKEGRRCSPKGAR